MILTEDIFISSLFLFLLSLSLGSAFVQFQDTASVHSCLEVSSSREQGINYGGQRLDVTVAVSRGEVERVCRERGDEGRRGRGDDKRNLYLAKEGGMIACIVVVLTICYLSIFFSVFSDFARV